MTQINITLESERLHGLFTSDGRDEAFLQRFLATMPNPFFEECLG